MNNAKIVRTTVNAKMLMYLKRRKNCIKAGPNRPPIIPSHNPSNITYLQSVVARATSQLPALPCQRSFL
jgi:hypothetical protein